ncbi:uncharacterized protein BDZ99DRAFT_460014 [Mytilinidion resinicola]|uniref:Uncharacterized protein n=1 Tax=Mytilinidion resinicola TaxID=574789 RepID=A0A6A6Z225_9PEZI|nr:uncharacterized protein BDZ99DRAFT_460014 [Mytilinidion resinicola]KAF2814344.1 hypothetical protein BDZ99DRAFT_460014 [Mytilinidion resinicola]
MRNYLGVIFLSSFCTCLCFHFFSACLSSSAICFIFSSSSKTTLLRNSSHLSSPPS